MRLLKKNRASTAKLLITLQLRCVDEIGLKIGHADLRNRKESVSQKNGGGFEEILQKIKRASPLKSSCSTISYSKPLHEGYNFVSTFEPRIHV